MALTPLFLADESALARWQIPEVGARLAPLLVEGRLATCAVIDLEVLYSARNLAVYEKVLAERRGLPEIPVTPLVLRRAIDIQHDLARIGQHRTSIPDLLIAATAESAALPVLHYDAEFERIASVTGQAQEWVVPRGSV